MGVGTNSMLALIGTAGVAASKISQGISEANDADKNELMAQKATMNAERLKNLKLKNKKLRLENRALKKKEAGGSK